jgi:hypothetical protein
MLYMLSIETVEGTVAGLQNGQSGGEFPARERDFSVLKHDQRGSEIHQTFLLISI